MDLVADRNELYGTSEYWDARYKSEGPNASFDWFKTYAQIRDILLDVIPSRSSKILILGCGNSSLSEDMYLDGFEDITNVDYSSVVISAMMKRHHDKKMKWLEMDVRDLQFEDHSFDVVIDKGTMDSMMTAKGSVWDPPPQVVADCTKEVDEITRSFFGLTCGVFIYITFGQPHFRRRYLSREGWDLEIRELGETFHYYSYIMRPIKASE
ncbi:hypothetical protein BS47DRAFT_1303165 [Hydnum rufescens UP504]|uniref:Methyltransferase type 11 domain-containing protein n=1 Tax=Hydnum rufescens UP504 TaxID=1448309 RepID=A0A9P6DR74_9AGAM|nr:hypothetical protein BS47DRAFT_1303165 [Hydnum rufescens UP504]